MLFYGVMIAGFALLCWGALKTSNVAIIYIGNVLSFDWLMNDPNAQKLRVITPSGIIGYIFGAQDFIDYLNDFIFPNQKSTLVGEMDFYDYEIPDEYKDIPWFNF